MGRERFVGRTLKGGYELKQILGEGSFGAVFLAESKQDNSLLAVKLYKQTDDEEEIEAFKQEARRQSSLQHKNIVPVYWFDIEQIRLRDEENNQFVQEYPFIVMMYANRGSLREHIENDALETEENAVNTVVYAASGVQYAHEKKVLHRDLKPENIVLHKYAGRDYLDILVTDFGLAVKAHANESSGITPQSIAGTPPYMAPEQFAGKAVIASDVYSLGIIAFELLAGRRPFEANDASDYADLHMNYLPPTFEQIRGANNMNSMLENLEVVVQKALEKQPAQRYSSVGDFAADLQDSFEAALSGQKKEKVLFAAYAQKKEENANVPNAPRVEKSFVEKYKKLIAIVATSGALFGGCTVLQKLGSSQETSTTAGIPVQQAESASQPDLVPLDARKELSAQEKTAWTAFLGKDIEIPPIPQGLIDTLKTAKEKGFNYFEAHYIPEMNIEEDTNYPGWGVKPESNFWRLIKDGTLSASATRLGGNWVLLDVDPVEREQFEPFAFSYKNDPLGTIMTELRHEGKVENYEHENSRFNVSWNEIHNSILPKIASKLNVDESMVRLPKIIEFNILGNLFHPEWGQEGTTAIWLEDRRHDNSEYHFSGGHPNYGGLANIESVYYENYKTEGIGFRPMIVFPS